MIMVNPTGSVTKNAPPRTGCTKRAASERREKTFFHIHWLTPTAAAAAAATASKLARRPDHERCHRKLGVVVVVVVVGGTFFKSAAASSLQSVHTWHICHVQISRWHTYIRAYIYVWACVHTRRMPIYRRVKSRTQFIETLQPLNNYR